MTPAFDKYKDVTPTWINSRQRKMVNTAAEVVVLAEWFCSKLDEITEQQFSRKVLVRQKTWDEQRKIREKGSASDGSVLAACSADDLL